MKTFKECVENDDLDVFLNLNEFAEDHDLNGTICRAVVQSPTSKERFISGADYSGYDGIFGAVVVVHCRKEDLPEVPAEGQIFRLDEKIHIVSSCVDDMGILSIELRAHEA